MGVEEPEKREKRLGGATNVNIYIIKYTYTETKTAFSNLIKTPFLKNQNGCEPLK